MEGTSTNAGKVAFEHIWECHAKQICVAKPNENTVYPIGVGLFGHILGVSWEVCFAVKPWQNTVYPIVACVFGPILAIVLESRLCR